MSKLSAYKASAGSGKTFTLTREYLYLLFENRNNFQHILAVTFTNKACGEMKGRILSQLHRLATGQPTPFAKLISTRFTLDDELLAQRSSDILNNILHNYSFFHVETIDKFFQGVVTNFAKELGIHSLQNIELDTNRVLENTITQLFVNIDDNPELKIWLNEYVASQVEKGENFDVRRNIFKLCQNLFHESVAAKITESSAFFDDREAINKMYDQLEQTVRDFENRMKLNGKRALEMMGLAGLSVADFSYGKSGFANYFNKIQDGEYEPTQRVMTALENPDSWSTKTSAKKQAIAAARDGGLMPLLRETIDCYQLSISDYNTANLLVKYRYVFPVISKFSAKVLDYCRENGIHLLSSNNLLLKNIIDGNPTPFVYEKTGTYLHHFMLDEFQDTSQVQWENIKPLVENSLSEGNRSLVVGDAKQSIYRWRNGDWTLLGTRIYEDFPGRVETFSLDTNYRSTRQIVEFNNMFFGICRERLQGWIDAVVSASAIELPPQLHDVMHKAYGDFEQKPFGKDGKEGFVQVTYCNASKNKDFDEEMAAWLPQTIERLQDNGYKASDIAIIVRKNQECKNVVDCLLGYKEQVDPDRYCFDVVSAEGLELQNSSAVMIIVSILMAWNNPADTLSRAFVVQEYGLKFEEKDINQIVAESKSFDVFMSEHGLDAGQAVSLYEKCEVIIHKLQLATSGEVPFLKDFLDHVLSYTVNTGSSAYSFLKWWKEKGAKLSVVLPSDQPAIQVLTIHKSKGLEFKAVIVPYCNWDLFNYRQTLLWPASKEFNFPFHPVDFRKDLAQSAFKAEYAEEMIQQLVDNINLLYVAFTRAEDALMVLTRETKQEDDFSSVADLMKFVANGSTTAEWGTMPVAYDVDTEESGVEEFLFPTPGMAESIVFATKGIEYFESLDKDGSRRTWGKVMHEILSGIERDTDLGYAISSAVTRGILGRDEAITVEKMLSGALRQPGVQPWFDGTAYFLPESSILCPDGTLKRPDRVMIRDREATVVDYKFGSSRDLPRHSRQVAEYMALLSRMGYSSRGFLWYVEENRVEEVLG